MMNRIIPALALIFAGGIFFGYVLPTYNGTIADTKTRIAGDDKALEAASTYLAKENELASAKNSISSNNLSHLQTLLPDSVNNVQMILDLNALAARSGVLISSINVAQSSSDANNSSGSNQDPVGAVDLSLTATGSYPSFRTFLGGIERSARILDLVHLTVTTSETGVYTYSMTLRLYWLR